MSSDWWIFGHVTAVLVSNWPMFASDVPYPFNWLNIAAEARLNPADADFVDVIHTDGKAR